MVLIACARVATRRGGRDVRAATAVASVWSLHRKEYPPRHAPRQNTCAPQLVTAAAMGPIVSGILETFQAAEYG